MRGRLDARIFLLFHSVLTDQSGPLTSWRPGDEEVLTPAGPAEHERAFSQKREGIGAGKDASRQRQRRNSS